MERGHGSASNHQTDQLIRDLAGAGRQVTAEEVDRIVERIAGAPFNPGMVRVPGRERGATYQGYSLGIRELSVTYHVVKRVVLEEQWAVGTTAEHYLADLRLAVRHPRARLAVFRHRGDHIAAVIVPTNEVVPRERLGAQALPSMLVIYSADRGMIRTGYQFSGLEHVDIPSEAQWLR